MTEKLSKRMEEFLNTHSQDEIPLYEYAKEVEELETELGKQIKSRDYWLDRRYTEEERSLKLEDEVERLSKELMNRPSFEFMRKLYDHAGDLESRLSKAQEWLRKTRNPIDSEDIMIDFEKLDKILGGDSPPAPLDATTSSSAGDQVTLSGSDSRTIQDVLGKRKFIDFC